MVNKDVLVELGFRLYPHIGVGEAWTFRNQFYVYFDEEFTPYYDCQVNGSNMTTAEFFKAYTSFQYKEGYETGSFMAL